jgi:hypothetical protein
MEFQMDIKRKMCYQIFIKVLEREEARVVCSMQLNWWNTVESIKCLQMAECCGSATFLSLTSRQPFLPVPCNENYPRTKAAWGFHPRLTEASPVPIISFILSYFRLKYCWIKFVYIESIQNNFKQNITSIHL